MDSRKAEDALEAVWMLQERGKPASLERVAQFIGEGVGADDLAHLRGQGWIQARDNGELHLTEAGRAQARDVVRRHRLAERLMLDVLGLKQQQAQEAACRFEHILNLEAAESICTLLGHPTLCPHGYPIPAGRCCETLSREVAPLVRPLTELTPGQSGEIAFLAPSFHRRLDRLSSFGILPGSRLQLHQKTPTYVVRVGHTELALEADVAREIYLRCVQSPQPEGSRTDADPVDRG
jgi:DtxR family Mn-dependent transcriptional regulator